MRFVSDTGHVFRRYLMQLLRNPAWVLIGAIQPIMYLALFGPLLKSVSTVTAFPGGAYNFFTPGLLVQLGLFGATGVGFGLISELRQGVIERMRVTPITRISLLLGRSLRDVALIVAQSIILIVCAIPFGINLSLPGVLATLAIIGLLGLMMASVSYSVALAVKSEDVFAPIVFTATLPLLLLSGVLLPIREGTAPDWLITIARFNPLKYAVDGARAAFNGNFGDAAVWQGFALIAILAMVTVTIAARSFSRAVA
jgi:ABC-type multidrug transport system, permease component